MQSDLIEQNVEIHEV